jgi:hypothetical protein
MVNSLIDWCWLQWRLEAGSLDMHTSCRYILMIESSSPCLVPWVSLTVRKQTSQKGLPVLLQSDILLSSNLLLILHLYYLFTNNSYSLWVLDSLPLSLVLLPFVMALVLWWSTAWLIGGLRLGLLTCTLLADTSWWLNLHLHALSPWVSLSVRKQRKPSQSWGHMFCCHFSHEYVIWNLPFTSVLSYESSLLWLFDRKEWVWDAAYVKYWQKSHSGTFWIPFTTLFSSGLFSAQKTQCEFSKATMTSSVYTYIIICLLSSVMVAAPAAWSIVVSIFVWSFFSVMWVFFELRWPECGLFLCGRQARTSYFGYSVTVQPTYVFLL